MDVHTSIGPFAEGWVTTNRQTTLNTEEQMVSSHFLESPTQLMKEQGSLSAMTLSIKHQPSPDPISLSPPSTSENMKEVNIKELCAKMQALEQESRSSKGTRSLPIHCIVERTSGLLSFDTSSEEKSTHNLIELDSYAILPGTTLLSECVHSALIKLGYSSSEVLGAKGAIQLKNWKPLCFEEITDNNNANIRELLGELTQVATLRIRICSATKMTSSEEVKEKLLQLLLSQSQTLLMNAGCQTIEKSTFPTNGQTLGTISPEMRRAFDRWYEEQLKLYTDSNCSSSSVNLAAAAKDLLALQQERLDMAMVTSRRDQREPIGTPEKISIANTSVPPHLSEISPPISRPVMSSSPSEPFSHPAYQHYLPGKTRMRTSFDPEHEIPRLQKWFSESQHPSREQMIQYLHELNSLDSRKGRRALDLTNIIYWFKNARAAHRRSTKNGGDDSFEIEDDKDPGLVSCENSIPYLPNRNAVYMVPYPQFPAHLGLLSVQNRSNGFHDDKEPCDLSMSSQRSKSPFNESRHENMCKSATYNLDTGSKSPEEKIILNVKVKFEKEDDKPISPVKPHEGYSETVEKSPTGNGSPVQENTAPEKCVKDLKYSSDMPRDFSLEKTKHVKSIDDGTELAKDEPNDLTVAKHSVGNRSDNILEDKPKDLSKGKRLYESDDDDDDDDFESDYDEDEHSMDGSISSHNEGNLSSLNESYCTSAQGLNFNGINSSSSGQPLHVPQFHHPLAMHYFPLNAHFFSQKANHLKFHNHHSPTQQAMPKTSPGQGQENSNSHRKRRTRVFIDPLSEIPKLEKWFLDDTHPSSYMIDKYCEELNSSEYRQKFPKLEPKNVQLWFKNHRAKVKRMRLGGIGDHHMFD